MSLKTRRLTVRLPEDLLDRLAYRAAAEGVPLSTLLREDLRKANARWRPPAPSGSGLTLVWLDAPGGANDSEAALKSNASESSPGGGGCVTTCVNPPDTEGGPDTPPSD